MKHTPNLILPKYHINLLMSVFSGGRGNLKRESNTSAGNKTPFFSNLKDMTDVSNSIDEKSIFNLETEEETETTPQQVTR